MLRTTRLEDGLLGNLAPPGNLEESASHHISSKSADLSRGVLECSKLEGLPSLNGFVLRAPRTDFVSHCKTNDSRAEVLISLTVRGGGGFVPSGRPIFLPQNKYFLCSP